MASSIKTLGQSKPGATTLTPLYTVPDLTQTTVSSIICCNQSGSAETVRVSVAVAGATDAGEQYLLYDKSIPANDTYPLIAGITLNQADVVRVYSSAGNVSFSIFGAEIS